MAESERCQPQLGLIGAPEHRSDGDARDQRHEPIRDGGHQALVREDSAALNLLEQGVQRRVEGIADEIVQRLCIDIRCAVMAWKYSLGSGGDAGRASRNIDGSLSRARYGPSSEDCTASNVVW